MSKKALAITISLLVLTVLGFYKFKPTPLGINLVGSGGSSYSVVVAGAGTGGISAAIQAARMGSKVLLTEETDLLGGQIGAAGVTSTDIGDWKWNSGISAEYIGILRSKRSKSWHMLLYFRLSLPRATRSSQDPGRHDLK